VAFERSNSPNELNQLCDQGFPIGANPRDLRCEEAFVAEDRCEIARWIGIRQGLGFCKGTSYISTEFRLFQLPIGSEKEKKEC
jgi:hypothetical protein